MLLAQNLPQEAVSEQGGFPGQPVKLQTYFYSLFPSMRRVEEKCQWPNIYPSLGAASITSTASLLVINHQK